MGSIWANTGSRFPESVIDILRIQRSTKVNTRHFLSLVFLAQIDLCSLGSGTFHSSLRSKTCEADHSSICVILPFCFPFQKRARNERLACRLLIMRSSWSLCQCTQRCLEEPLVDTTIQRRNPGHCFPWKRPNHDVSGPLPNENLTYCVLGKSARNAWGVSRLGKSSLLPKKKTVYSWMVVVQNAAIWSSVKAFSSQNSNTQTLEPPQRNEHCMADVNGHSAVVVVVASFEAAQTRVMFVWCWLFVRNRVPEHWECAWMNHEHDNSLRDHHMGLQTGHE